MAIIKCPECKTEVSDKAEKCLKCAFPINEKPVNVKAQTIELTSKRFKKQQLIAAAVTFIGVFIMVMSSVNNSSGGSTFGALLMFGGLIWSVVVRTKIWWHHK